jgi:hypothetical protein
VLLHQYGCCNSNKTSLNQNSNSFEVTLNPKSALKPLASFKLGSITSVTAGGVRSENNTGLKA